MFKNNNFNIAKYTKDAQNKIIHSMKSFDQLCGAVEYRIYSYYELVVAGIKDDEIILFTFSKNKKSNDLYELAKVIKLEQELLNIKKNYKLIENKISLDPYHYSDEYPLMMMMIASQCPRFKKYISEFNCEIPI